MVELYNEALSIYQTASEELELKGNESERVLLCPCHSFYVIHPWQKKKMKKFCLTKVFTSIILNKALQKSSNWDLDFHIFAHTKYFLLSLHHDHSGCVKYSTLYRKYIMQQVNHFETVKHHKLSDAFCWGVKNVLA